jgi:hypothetical protein
VSIRQPVQVVILISTPAPSADGRAAHAATAAPKPLKLPEVHDPNWWIKGYVQREGIDTSALVHPTIALRHEADTFPQSLAELTTEEQVRTVIEDFNRRVVAEWRRPLTGPSLPVVARQVPVEPMIDRWRALRAKSEDAEREVESPQTLSDAAPQTGGWWRGLAARLTRGDATQA